MYTFITRYLRNVDRFLFWRIKRGILRKKEQDYLVWSNNKGRSMKAKQYFPNFFEGFTPKEIEFDTLDELLNTDWIKSKEEYGDFKEWAISGNCLMVIYTDSWYVVAYLDKEAQETLDLPKWRSGKG